MPPSAQPSRTAHALQTDRGLTLRVPTAEDGAAIWRLVAAVGTLDPNSLYCNLLQCTHFAETSIIAEDAQGIVGWISAYRQPTDREPLFVWQVAVDPRARGRGIARSMVMDLIARPDLTQCTQLQTTITPDNDASWALFRSLARSLEADLTERPWLLRDRHFAGTQATEHLVTVAPLRRQRRATQAEPQSSFA